MLIQTLQSTEGLVYVEWGTGCSANWFPYFARKSYLIDGSPYWGGLASNGTLQRCLADNGALEYKLVPMQLPNPETGELEDADDVDEKID